MTDAGDKTVRVWDPAVRLFHWSLVAAFAFAWLSGDVWDRPHEIAGYFILGLVAFRLLWGLIGPHYARFAQFIRPPHIVLGYLRTVLTGRERRYLGHNPAGGVMVAALLTMIAVTCLAGWMMTLDMFWGVEWVEELHEITANSMLFLIALHVAGVIVTGVRHGENLVRAMIGGRKRKAAGDDVA